MNLVFNVKDLKDKVVPNIKRDSKYLNLSYDALASISVPSDFEYRSRLISLPQKIKDIENKSKKIEKWVNVAIINLKSAEVNNTKEMNKLTSSISKLNLGLNSKVNKTGGKTTATSKVTTSVKKIINYAFSKKLILDASSLAKKTASKVVSKVKSKISWALSTGAKIVNKAKSFIANKVSATLEFIGGKITSAWKWMSKKIFTPLGNILKRTFASIANVAISFVKGLCEFIESLFDVVVMLGAGLASIFTGIWDGITYLASDNKEEWESTTSKMWKETMGFVAEEHVENAYNAFFKETIVGQWLDDNAYAWFKSDGVVCGISSGLGYVAGIIILTVATAGIGTGAVAASTSTTVVTQATIATVSGIGKYTQESWAAKRDSSWEGIERMYQKGEISEEQFNSYVMIRELTDAEWAEIEQDYENGLISEEEYNAMKQIREMPDDWKTLENGLKGLAYGVANGVWEGVQWYVGGKLAGWTIKSGSQAASATVRVMADTGFNALDTPFRTTVEALTSDKTWEEAWNDQGGAKSVLTNTIIGLIGSAGGEAFDNIKAKIKTNNYDNGFKQGTRAEKVVLEQTEINAETTELVNKNNKVIRGPRNNVENVRLTSIDKLKNRLLLDRYDRIMKKGTKSNNATLYLSHNALKEALDSGNKDAYKYAKSMVNLKKKYPRFSIRTVSEGGTNINTSCWSLADMTIYLEDDVVSKKYYSTFYHESGHALYALNLQEKLPNNWEDILSNAKLNSSNNGKLDEIKIKFQQVNDSAWKYSAETAEKQLRDFGYNSTGEYLDFLEQSINYALQTGNLNFDPATSQFIIDALNSGMTASEIAASIYCDYAGGFYEQYWRTQAGEYTGLSDIIDAVYKGIDVDLNNNPIFTVYKHGRQYYENARKL